MSSFVDLQYNPYSQAASLRINGREFNRPGSRLHMFVVDKPIHAWLEPVTRGYQQWNGFLPELLMEINDDHVTVTFFGLEDYYLAFSRSMTEQMTTAERLGFDAAAVKYRFTEAYAPQKIVESILKIWQNCGVAVPTQRLSLHREALEDELRNLKDSPPETVDQVMDLVDAHIAFANDFLHAIAKTAPQQRAEIQSLREKLERLIG